MRKTHNRQIFILASIFLSLLMTFQNCSEIKPLTSEGEFIPEPGDQGDGSGDNNGDGGDSGDTGGGNTSGTYDNSDPYKCDYNDDGVVDFETRTNGVANTSRPAGMKLIQPQGFTMYKQTWEDQFGQAFGIRDTIPSTLGAFSVNASDSRGMYITIQFRVPDSSSNQWRIFWDLAQPNYMGSNYPLSRTSNPTHVTISPCAGDVRPRNNNTTEPWTRYCRWTVASGQIIFNSKNEPGCQVKPGKTYWLTIMMADPRKPDYTGEELLPTETSCVGGNIACESAFWFEVE